MRRLAIRVTRDLAYHRDKWEVELSSGEAGVGLHSGEVVVGPCQTILVRLSLHLLTPFSCVCLIRGDSIGQRMHVKRERLEGLHEVRTFGTN